MTANNALSGRDQRWATRARNDCVLAGAELARCGPLNRIVRTHEIVREHQSINRLFKREAVLMAALVLVPIVVVLDSRRSFTVGGTVAALSVSGLQGWTRIGLRQQEPCVLTTRWSGRENNSGRTVLAMDCVLAGAECAPWLAAQQNR
jgi:hypothetical protein